LLADQERVLGPDHPSTLATRSNLALVRGQAGDPVGSVAGLETLLADQVRVLGPDHPSTLATWRILMRGRVLLIVLGRDGGVAFLDPVTGLRLEPPVGPLDHVNAVCAVQVDDRTLLASAGNDRTVRIWDPSTGQSRAELVGHTDRVNAVCAVQVDDRTLLASAGNDRTVRIWDPASGRLSMITRLHFQVVALVPSS
jgi:WD40 repeat protein